MPIDLITQLRVGNHVSCKVSGDAGIYTVQAIDAIYKTVTINRAGTETHHMRDIKARALSADVLTHMCGDKITRPLYSDMGVHHFIWRCGQRHASMTDVRGGAWLLRAHVGNDSLEITIAHLHQFQNLIYQLYGWELSYNGAGLFS